MFNALQSELTINVVASIIVSLLFLGLGFLWAFVDRDRQFLHDRLAGTALVDRPRA